MSDAGRILRRAFAAACVFALGVTAQAAENDDVQDLIYLSPQRPIAMRLHLRVDGQPFSKLKTAAARQIFESLDADGNGVLEGKEVAGIPPVELLAAAAKSSRGQAAAGNRAARVPPRGRVTPDELAAYMQPFFASPFTVTVDAGENSGRKSPEEGPVPPALNGYQQMASLDLAAFLAILDADGDGRITLDECARVDELFHTLDLNDDETISGIELAEVAAAKSAARRGQSSPLGGMAAQLQPVDRGELRLDCVHALTERYRRMSRAEAAIWFADAKPQFELDVALPQKSLQRPTVSVRGGSAAAAEQSIGVHLGKEGEVILRLGPLPIALKAAEAPPRPVSRTAYAKALFRRADRDNNGYLDASELTTANLGLDAEQFKAIDRDHNGMIFEEEWISFMTLYGIVSDYRITLTVAATSVDPIAEFDSNGDGRLTHGEWKRALATVRSWDVNHDGQISADEIPRHFEGTFHLGTLPGVAKGRAMSDMIAPSAPPLSAAPAWFQKMDRNRDGEVSLREFLGPLSVFRRLDANHDGYLDAGEARSTNDEGSTKHE